MNSSFSLFRLVTLGLMLFLLALQLENQRVFVEANCREETTYTTARYCFMFPSKKRHLTQATMVEDPTSFGQILGGNLPPPGPPAPVTDSPFLASFTDEANSGQFPMMASQFPALPQDPQPPLPPIDVPSPQEDPFDDPFNLPAPAPAQPDSPDDEVGQLWFGIERTGRFRRSYIDEKKAKQDKYEAIIQAIMRKCCGRGTTCIVAELVKISKENYETVCPA